MAKITDLIAVDAITGDEFLPIVQRGATKRATMSALRALIVPFLQYWYKGDRGDPGPAGATHLTLAGFQAAPIANDRQTLKDPAFPFADYYFDPVDHSAATAADLANLRVIKANGVPLTAGAWIMARASGLSYRPRGMPALIDLQTKAQDHLTKSDFGIVGDGVTNDTAAIVRAAVEAMKFDRELHLPGRYAVANLRLPGAPDGDASSYLHITGNPVFIQAIPNAPILSIQTDVLQQSTGHRVECTVVPHPDSDKSNPGNIAVDLTGFSASEIKVRLGRASASSATKGRFNTMVYARSSSPFHYQNCITVIANTVPAPATVLRYDNGGMGVGGNPNINSIRAWCVNLDTVEGDVLLDLADSTQAIVTGPSLLEACPHAVGIRAGNITTIENVWFELVGTDVEMVPTAYTTPNNVQFRRCYFSGAGHFVRISNDVLGPPTFDHCVNDGLVSFIDQGGSPIPHKLYTRGYPQPPVPTVAYIGGGASLDPQDNSVRYRVDHHGRTTSQLTYISRPGAPGLATLRITPPVGYEIEHAEVGVRDASNTPLASALGDDLAGRDRSWVFATVADHVVNVRVTLRATS